MYLELQRTITYHHILIHQLLQRQLLSVQPNVTLDHQYFWQYGTTQCS